MNTISMIIEETLRIPDEVQVALRATLTEGKTAKIGDILALTFRYTQGRFDAVLTPKVSALFVTEDGLDDLDWGDIPPAQRKDLADLAMTVMNSASSAFSWLQQGCSEVWPDADDGGVEVYLFRDGATYMPEGCDDQLAYGDENVSCLLCVGEAKSQHQKLRSQSATDDIISIWRRSYKVEVDQ
jgi:hypothetical protein